MDPIREDLAASRAREFELAGRLTESDATINRLLKKCAEAVAAKDEAAY